MKVIGSKCEVPGLNISGVVIPGSTAHSNVRYSLTDHVELTEWAVTAGKKLLIEKNISPEDIGVIIGISIAVTGTTACSNSAAPGICHTVQRDLNMKNAFVFDLFHSDLCTAMNIADMFLVDNSRKYGMVIKCEKFDCFINESSFSWSDALSIVLIEHEVEDTANLNHYHLSDEIKSGSKLQYLTNTDINNVMVNFQIKWDLDLKDQLFLSKRMADIAKNYLENEKCMEVITEKWFAESKVENKNQIHLGMHHIPWKLQTLLTENRQLGNVKAVAFNPFLSQYTSISFNI